MLGPFLAAGVAAAPRLELRSPDGLVAVGFDLDATGRPTYDLAYGGVTVLEPSRLGLSLEGAPDLDGGFRVERVQRTAHDETWRPVYGERSEIRDHYGEMIVELADGNDPLRHLALTFRAYNEGAALCYTIPRRPGLERLVIAAEQTQFRFAANHVCYPVYSAQGLYQRAGIDEVKPNCERPLLVEVADNVYAAVGEARLVDYARMRFQPDPRGPHALQAMLAGKVVAELPLKTPWRVILLGHSPGELLQRNGLFLNLNDPCAIADTSWIKPGKVIREVTLTTEGGKACVDFAVQRGLQYVEYDAGWYGNEYDDASDASTVTRDAKKSSVRGDLDLHEVIRYADQRGIGILVYVNRRQLERQLDEILPLYAKWGIKGVKYGFVQVGSQQWTAWLHEAVRKAAAHRLMVDVHDEYRPTGFERTYPNLMTQEGVRGNETMPTAEHNCILPFTRMLCGAADATICWYTPRIKTTHAHQLGCAVVFYSPWQFLYWYDRPAQYRGEPELEFFQRVPTVWDQTRVIRGEIGRYVVIARRSGHDWYVGVLNARKRRTLEVPLEFLPPGRRYRAFVHTDGSPSGDAPTSVRSTRQVVDSGTVLSVDAAHNGGGAIRIVPLEPGA